MSLNCLTCQSLQRTDSEKRLNNGKNSNFSGNLVPFLNYKTIRDRPSLPMGKKAKKGHRRLYSTGAVVYEGSGEPRLVRSSGIRRDWSFEDLRREQDHKQEDFKAAKKGHRRLYSTGVVVYEGLREPKLARSTGIRRDWSFEDLRKKTRPQERRFQETMNE